MGVTPTVSDFFSKKNVFVTGGTGFIGKVLIEKLLRSCPDVKNVYLLLREKKGHSVDKRLKTITDLPLFDLLKSQNPEALKKLKPVCGDVKDLKLGLSLEDQKVLTEEVNIVFHGADSVRFDDSLKTAVLLNTRGTRETVNLALQMKNLEVFVHVSSTYCHCDHKIVEEKMYPPHADWKTTIKIVEEVGEHVLNALTDKFIHPLPNTYTFAKSLGEHVVYDLIGGVLPLVIYRPSVVVHSAFEPMPSWVDNFNGPMGLGTGVMTGLVRTLYIDQDKFTDFIPVDLVVKLLILTAWKQATCSDKLEKLTPSVYHSSNYDVLPIRLSRMINFFVSVATKEQPFDTMLWYPNCTITKCYYYFFIETILYHVLPGVVIDAFLRIMGKKPFLVKLHRTIFRASIALKPFSHNEWEFLNKKSRDLQKQILPEDFASFALREEEITYDYIFSVGNLGMKRYLMKEKDDVEKTKEKAYKMWILAQVVNFLWYLGLFWILFFILDVVGVVTDIAVRFFYYITID